MYIKLSNDLSRLSQYTHTHAKHVYHAEVIEVQVVVLRMLSVRMTQIKTAMLYKYTK